MSEGLTFGDALDLLKAGKRVARAGWNGKGMWLVLLRLRAEPTDLAIRGTPIRAMPPCIGMFTAQGEMQPGWLASQPDMLAEDWQEVTP